MGPKARILIVDDNEAGRYALTHCLRKAGHETLEVGTAQECFKHLAVASADLILLDVKLPDLSGIEVCRRVKKDPHTADIPIIQISALFTGADDRIAGLESGADAYLSAPFQPRELLAHVNGLLRLRDMQAALRRSEERYRLLFDKSPDGVFCLDPRGRFTLVNPACERISGYSEAELLNRDFVSLCSPDRLPKTSEEFQRSLREPRYGELETAFIRKDGTRVEVLVAAEGVIVDGQIVALHCTAKDISRRKAIEDELRRTRDTLQTVLNSAPAGIIVADNQGRIVLSSAATERILGSALDGDAHGPDRNYTVFLPDGRPIPRGQMPLSRALTGASVADQEMLIRRSDGSESVILAGATPLRSSDGSQFGAVTVFQDITARKQFQSELERLVDERTARLQELVGELEHFSYTITHDMRAPLRSMRGFAQLVQDLCSSCKAPERAFLDRIIASADRMDALITDALSYSKAVRQDLPLGPVDAGALLRSMLDSYPEFQASKARIQLQRDIPLVFANQAGLTQCFSNLLANAVKFVAPDTTPKIRIWAETVCAAPAVPKGTPQAAEVEPRPADPGSQGNRRIRIWIEDNGIGIPENIRHRLFNMFARGSSQYEGTGIGLALVRKVVDRMGGRVGVESKVGKGSRFWIELRPGDPRYPVQTVLPSPPPDLNSIL